MIVSYFVSAADPEKESVVKIAWPNSDEATTFGSKPSVTVHAYCDNGDRMEPIEVVIPSCKTRVLTFNSGDLEYGNIDQHIPHGIEGSATGYWWLRLQNDSNFLAHSLIHANSDSFWNQHSFYGDVDDILSSVSVEPSSDDNAARAREAISAQWRQTFA